MALTQEFTTQAGALCVGVAAMASPVAAALTPVLIPLTAMAAMGLHLKDGCAKTASAKAQKAIIRALKGHPEFPPETLTRVQSLLKDADSPLNLSRETLLAAARSGAFEAEVVQHLLAPLALDQGESSVRQILETALLAGLGACRKDESFHQALTQELLIEAAHVANVQLKLLDEIKADTTEIKARLDELTLQNGTLAKALDTLESQSKGQLEALASRFEIPRAYDMSTEQLRAELNARAEDYRTYRAEIEAIDERTKGLGNLKAAAADAADRLDFEEVENLLSRVDEVETEIAAQGKVLRASNALMRGRAEQAYTILSAAADSFRSIDKITPSEKCNKYFLILYDHGNRYGGLALPFAITLLQEALKPLKKDGHPELWASINNNLGVALEGQANRTQGALDVRKQAIAAYHDALSIRTKHSYPFQWATTQNNLAGTLANQALNTQGEAGSDLLTQAVLAFHNVQTVYTKSEFPAKWAMTQNNLGTTLNVQANRIRGEAGLAVLQLAATAFKDALTVRTKKDFPEEWAMSKNNLAATRADQAYRTKGAAAAMLFKQASEAWQQALTVRTHNNHSVHWAETNVNLAILEFNLARHDSTQNPHPHTQNPHPHIEVGLTYINKALTVFDPIHMAPDHANATRLRDDRLQALSD